MRLRLPECPPTKWCKVLRTSGKIDEWWYIESVKNIDGEWLVIARRDIDCWGGTSIIEKKIDIDSFLALNPDLGDEVNKYIH